MKVYGFIDTIGQPTAPAVICIVYDEEITMSHPLHQAIGEALDNAKLKECEILKDQACGGDQNIPLFVGKSKSNTTEYCNIDLLVLKNDRIRVIIEIEETNILPTKICGKFLTSALASCYRHSKHGNSEICMGESVLFIQVVDSSKLKKGKTSKPKQFENIMTSIKAILPLKNTTITDYRLFLVAGVQDESKVQAIVREIKKAVCILPNQQLQTDAVAPYAPGSCR
jgi:hypothetical protein